MAAINSLFDWKYSGEEYDNDDANDDVLDYKVDDVQKMKQEIKNLKDALLSVNATLKPSNSSMRKMWKSMNRILRN